MVERRLNVDFRGSYNQHIIDVPASLEARKVVLIQKYIGERYVNVSIPKKEHIYI